MRHSHSHRGRTTRITVLVLAVACAAPATAGAAAAWLPATNLSAAGRHAFRPEIAVDSAGNAVAAWYGQDDYTVQRVRVSTRPAGGQWSAQKTLSAFGKPASGTRVAVDAKGNAVVVWSLDDGDNLRVQASVRPAGGAWGAALTLSPAGVGRDAARCRDGRTGERNRGVERRERGDP